MTYTAEWVNRINLPHKVEIDLNLTNGNLFRKIPFQWFKTPAEVDDAFLAGIATAVIARAQAEDDYKANIAAFILANADLQLVVMNNTDIDTAITRNSLPWTRTQIRAAMADQVADMNRLAIRTMAERRYG